MDRRPLTASSATSNEAPTMIVSVALAHGVVLAGKYEVERVLGEGGMGVVVAARHLQLGKRVALKFLLADAGKNPDTVQRFLREAQSASRIRSEHVARVLDLGTMDSGAPFLVMEFLEGQDLGAVLLERGALPIDVAVDYVLQGMEAIAEAHGLGIVHRDIKPSNLFLCRRADGSPMIKVLDFGLSKNLVEDKSQQSLTRTSAGAMGSPLYMSPEQVRSARNASTLSDIWSIGVMLYELVTADAPFDGENVNALLASVVADAPKPLRVARPSAPEAFERAVMRCLEKDPSRRYADVGALATALAPFASASGRSGADRVVGALSAASMVSTGSHVQVRSTVIPAKIRSLWTFASDPEGGRRKKGALLFAGALIGCVAVGTATFLTFRLKDAPRSDVSDPDPTPAIAPPRAEPTAPPEESPPQIAVAPSGTAPADPSAEPPGSASAAAPASAPASASASAPPRRPGRPPPRPGGRPKPDPGSTALLPSHPLLPPSP